MSVENNDETNINYIEMQNLKNQKNKSPFKKYINRRFRRNNKNQYMIDNDQSTTITQQSEANSANITPQVVLVERQSRFESIRKNFLDFYIDPFGNFYYIWLILISICYIYSLVFLIARFSFWLLQDLDHYYYIWFIIDYGICDIIYIFDIVIRLMTGFMKNGEICKDKKFISIRYIKSAQFKMDVISIFPTEFFIFLMPNDMRFRAIPALRLNRLFRFSRLTEFRYLTETLTKYPTVFRMSSLLLNILVAMHWNACIYFMLSGLMGYGSDTFVYPAFTNEEMLQNLTYNELNNLLMTHHLDTQYFYSFWWSVQTLTTIGEVQQPKKYYQEIYMSLMLMIGVVILGITIGSASDMVENANRQNLELQAKCDDAKSFLKQNRITGELETRIKNYLDYLWISSENIQSSDVLDKLPANLKKEIATNVHIETLKRVHVFQDCEPNLLGELVTKLKLQIYSPGDYVCRKGDVGHEMYFIKTGKLQVVSPDGSQVFATMSAGAAFGEISILDIPGNKNGNKRTANIRSLGFSDVYQLSKNDLWTALSEYPMAKKSLLEKGRALLKKDNLIDEELAIKAEQKLKPLHEKVENFLKNDLDEISKKIDRATKSLTAFLKETKDSIYDMETTINF